MTLHQIISLPRLFKPHANGKSKVFWEVQHMGNRVRALSGVVGGKVKIGSWTICTSTNDGKANERSPEEQAAFVAESHWKKQKKRGYAEQGESAMNRIYPMLAHTFDPEKTKLEAALIQPKLNGVRCLISRDGMFSRKGEKFVSAPHIQESLAGFFRKNPTFVLDGELYNHDLREHLNRLMSLVRKTNVDDDILAESEEIVQFHIYDGFDSADSEYGVHAAYAHRWKHIVACLSPQLIKRKSLRLVETRHINSNEQAEKVFATYVDYGYEGAMIRFPSGGYLSRRSSTLLKYKPWQDEEFRIIDVLPGKGKKTGYAGSVLCEHIKGPHKGTQFSSNIVGNFEFLADLLRDKRKYVGTLVTVRYAYLTEYGKPFHPEATHFWSEAKRSV